MPVDVQAIESLGFFQGLKLDEIEEFAELLNHKDVRKGDVIIQKGTPALTFYIVLSGVFEVSSETGLTLTLDQKGDIMGWSTVVAPFEYQGTVKALEDGNLVYISSHDFFQLIQNNNELGEKLMKKIDVVATERREFLAGNR